MFQASLYARRVRGQDLICRRSLRWSSTEAVAQTPPLMGKIRNDLKGAMRAKDTARLNVLRSIITENLNASKGSNPIRTDMQVLAMIRKRKAASKAAAQEFADAKRDDLKQKQDAEIAILNEYAGQVKIMPENEIREAIAQGLQTLKASGQKLNAGLVMRDLLKPGGLLDGKAVEKGDVSKFVQEALEAS